jgi:hypothetical protein
LFLNGQLGNQFTSAKWSLPPLAIGKLRNRGVCKHHRAMASAGKTVVAQFTKALSIHRGFYK